MNTTTPKLWTSGDWNAFFGFGTNILVNVLTLTALLRYVLKLPDDIVFGRILPATGLMLFLSTIYYAWLAYQLARKEGRDTVCALPSGISVPHMFVVVFVIMLPISAQTGDPIKGWEAGLTWVFVQSFVLMAGGFIAPYIKKITPRAALLGALAGVSIAFISLKPALDMYMDPIIGVGCAGMRAAGHLDLHALLFRAQLVALLEQQWNAAVHEHRRLFLHLGRIDRAGGQHDVQHARHRDDRIVDHDPEAAAQRVRDQPLFRRRRDLEVRHTNDAFRCPGTHEGRHATSRRRQAARTETGA